MPSLSARKAGAQGAKIKLAPLTRKRSASLKQINPAPEPVFWRYPPSIEEAIAGGFGGALAGQVQAEPALMNRTRHVANDAEVFADRLRALRNRLETTPAAPVGAGSEQASASLSDYLCRSETAQKTIAELLTEIESLI